MRDPSDWAELALGEGIQLLLGWREGRRELEARPVELSVEVGDEMRGACRNTLTRLAELRRRSYSGVPAIDADEYLALSLENDEEVDEGPATSEELVSASALVDLVNNAFENEYFLTREELKRGSWLFYAVVIELEGNERPIAFVRQFNPQRGIKAGRLLAAFQDTLSRFDDPLFNFDLKFDLVLAPDELAILSTTAFERVFADVEVAAAQVPDHIDQMASELRVRIESDSARRLTEFCQERPRFAQRLRRIARCAYLPQVTIESLRDALEKHDLPADRFGAGAELEVSDSEDVLVLFDMLEQLYYEADFTGEHRRADRFSIRQ